MRWRGTRMDATADRGAFAEAVVFLSYFDDLPDPRQRGKVVYPLDEVLLLALLAVLAGAETFVDIARFGAKKLALLRRSGQKTSGKAPLHMVSAFATHQRLVLGQVKVAEKSNEIVAIPKLLDLMAIEGAVVTIDAIGCQRDIAQTILDQKADYVLALKGNQGTLREDVELFVAEQTANSIRLTLRTSNA